MKKYFNSQISKILGMTLMSMFLLSGCTAFLWNSMYSGDVVSKASSEKLVLEDQIMSFAQLKKNNGTSQFVILGEQYTYLMDTGNENVMALLKSGLDPQYWRIYGSRLAENQINIGLIQGKTQDQEGILFNTNFSMYYAKASLTEREKNILDQIRFCCKSRGGQNDDIWYFGIAMQGHIIKLKKQVKLEEHQNLSHKYQISAYAKNNKKYDIDYANLFGKIALTPFTLIGDIVVVPFLMLSK